MIKNAIAHYTYGITHDIFSEPVTSYAELAVDALEKQIPKKPHSIGKYGYGCPNCDKVLGYDADDRYVYEIILPNYCEHCGQALDWSE